MKNIKTAVSAIVVGAALAATLGLVACDNDSSASKEGNATSEPVSATSEPVAAASEETDSSASIAAIAEELFSDCYVGANDKDIVYFYGEGDEGKAALLAIYDAANETLSFHLGKVEKPTADTVIVDTKGAGEAIEFKVGTGEGKTAYTFADGATVIMEPVINDDTLAFLQSVDEFIAELDSSTGEAA